MASVSKSYNIGWSLIQLLGVLFCLGLAWAAVSDMLLNQLPGFFPDSIADNPEAYFILSWAFRISMVVASAGLSLAILLNSQRRG
jgi:hypothetical protein